MRRELKQLAGFARLDTLPMIARRATGLSMWGPEDFMPPLEEDTRAQLRTFARAIRDGSRSPAVFIHGVLPRSGTNLLSDILALHPRAAQNPGTLWEFPLLASFRAARAMEAEFHFAYAHNAEVMQPYMLLAATAQGWLRALQQEVPGKRMVLKSPHMQGIGLFDCVLPDDRLFLVLRDGRDVAASSMTTFGRRIFAKSFSAIAQEWALATEAALLAAEQIGPRAMLIRFEDLANARRPLIETVLAHAGLEPALYPWAALERLPVRGSSETAAAGGANWTPQARGEAFNPVGRWKSWPEGLKQKFNTIAGSALIAAGYECGPAP